MYFIIYMRLKKVVCTCPKAKGNTIYAQYNPRVTSFVFLSLSLRISRNFLNVTERELCEVVCPEGGHQVIGFIPEETGTR